MVAKTFFGLEELLAGELKRLGAVRVQTLNRAVSFVGDKKMMYLSNYCLRTALKILIPISTAEINDEKSLYQWIRNVNWQRYLNLHDTFAVEAVLKSTVFNHSHYIEQKIKDGIVDWFRDRFGQRPSVNISNPDVKIHANITNKTLRLSLDSSGHALFRRGYRVIQGSAPLNEVLAAGLIKLSGWSIERPFVDFMCGSGTLPIEAVMAGLNIPAGATGREYGFQKWRDYDPNLFNQVLNECTYNNPKGIRVYASDVSPEAVRIARQNAHQVKAGKHISFSRQHFNDFAAPSGSCLIIVNPPYGERMKQENLNELYSELGNKLKRDFIGSEAWIFSSNKEALKHIGLRPAKKLTLYNGQLECKFHQYLLYQGSKRSS